MHINAVISYFQLLSTFKKNLLFEITESVNVLDDKAIYFYTGGSFLLFFNFMQYHGEIAQLQNVFS